MHIVLIMHKRFPAEAHTKGIEQSPTVGSGHFGHFSFLQKIESN